MSATRPGSAHVDLCDATATEAAGAALGRAWAGAGGPGLVVALEGDLGAGKTTLMRGLLQALGATGPVRSPTYTLIESYRLAGELTVHHLDFYRIDGWEAAEHVGFRDLPGPRSLVAVEWASRVERLPGEADLNATLTLAGDGRRLTLAAQSPAGAAVLARLAASLQVPDNG